MIIALSLIGFKHALQKEKRLRCPLQWLRMRSVAVDVAVDVGVVFVAHFLGAF